MAGCPYQAAAPPLTEQVFRGLDYALDEARKHGLRVSCMLYFGETVATMR